MEYCIVVSIFVPVENEKTIPPPISKADHRSLTGRIFMRTLDSGLLAADPRLKASYFNFLNRKGKIGSCEVAPIESPARQARGKIRRLFFRNPRGWLPRNDLHFAGSPTRRNIETLSSYSVPRTNIDPVYGRFPEKLRAMRELKRVSLFRTLEEKRG